MQGNSLLLMIEICSSSAIETVRSKETWICVVSSGRSPRSHLWLIDIRREQELPFRISDECHWKLSFSDLTNIGFEDIRMKTYTIIVSYKSRIAATRWIEKCSDQLFSNLLCIKSIAKIGLGK